MSAHVEEVSASAQVLGQVADALSKQVSIFKLEPGTEGRERRAT
jgi:methyl-accepting chemotaxis protein